MTEPNLAILRAKNPPTEEQKAKIEAFLASRYQEDIFLEFRLDEQIDFGFVLIYKDEIFDWTPEGKLRDFTRALDEIPLDAEDYYAQLKKKLLEWRAPAKSTELGHVISVGDGIARIEGLEHVAYHEILIFADGSHGMVLDIKEESLAAIIFGDDTYIEAGSIVRRSGRPAGIPVSNEVIGRVLNPLGEAIDGLGEISQDQYYPVEYPAPAILDRAPVHKPLQTGILAIDSMFPIGRGQRELIIGDRQTGKTAIAIDTILNQKGQDVICIYVAIGQRASAIARLREQLKKAGALDYTLIVAAFAGDSSALQYVAPYSGTSIAEYFMKKGKDVLIVYDDLSKHAVAYRAISLLLERFPGREAYPGDIFYLHSRLLERSAQMSAELGGGSITALPIVETQSGDISAYIPTNVISITDGQIFLETELFHAGQRPAINVGLSVSRVGGAAQTSAMKKASGVLRLLLAQYREIEIFTQFSGDVDDTSKKQLRMGQGIMQILRQNHSSPYSLAEQVLILVIALSEKLMPLEPEQWPEVLEQALAYIREDSPQLLAEINHSKNLSDHSKSQILELTGHLLDRLDRQGKITDSSLAGDLNG